MSDDMDEDLLLTLMLHDHEYGKHAVAKHDDCPDCKEATP